MSPPARLRLAGRGSVVTVALDDYLDPPALDVAEAEANAWVKRLRHVAVEGIPFRDRFTYRGDSLWWFAELYLHKERTVVTALRAILALEALIERERPARLDLQEDNGVVRILGPQIAARHGVGWRDEAVKSRARRTRRHLIARRSRFHTFTALADRLRPGRGPAGERPAVAAFVHSAFWRVDAGEESYIGPVLAEVAGRLGASRVALIGLGPRTNFRARSWRQRWREFRDPAARRMPWTPVEQFAPWGSLAGSTRLWRDRHRIARTLAKSADLCAASVVRGYDVWPLVAEDLAGIALLQYPWSARAMDEAGAALDALRPAVAVTYAEAGGWGRALVLEARRRGIPVVGVQHGFIYRHWLNYLHAPDEMAPSGLNAADRGFPRPDLTLVYDRFTAEHLCQQGAFPQESLVVCGNPRLDAFLRVAARMTADDRRRVRASVGAGDHDRLVVVATKFTQLEPVFADLVRAASAIPGLCLVIKCHPAETPEPYLRATREGDRVRVAPPSADLAELISSAEAVVTVNSTAAIEAMVLDVPALVLALPSNLSPFVDAGAMAGVPFGGDIGPSLIAILYNEERRQQLSRARRAFMARHGIAPDEEATVRAATEILQFAARASS